MQISFVTSNNGKVASLRRVCEPLGIKVNQVSLELPEPQVSDLRVITQHKAEAAFKEVQGAVVVQDTGFYLEAWPNFPGPFVKFTLDSLGIDGYLTLVEERSRECEFRECIAFFDGDQVSFFESKIPGRLATSRQGIKHPEAWSELWEIFIPEDFDKTIADMTDKERADWRSRRGDGSASLFARWYADRGGA